MIHYTFFQFLVLLWAAPVLLNAQLQLGNSQKVINFRSGPGLNFKVVHTIDKSDLLVIMPQEAQNGFVEVFDVETSSIGYVYESLVSKTDTLQLQDQHQHLSESDGNNENGDVEIILINRTAEQLFYWINGNSYSISPFEKKTLVLQDEGVTYFSSVPGVFPIYGKEVLEKGNSYVWNFSL